MKEAKPELPPSAAVQIGSYGNSYLRAPYQERQIFEGFADVLRANSELSVCLIYRPLIKNPSHEETAETEDPE